MTTHAPTTTRLLIIAARAGVTPRWLALRVATNNARRTTGKER